MSLTTRAVVEGRKVRFTLEQLETQNPNRVRVDWLRFTLPVDSLDFHAHFDFSGVDRRSDEFASACVEQGAWDAQQCAEELGALAVQVKRAALGNMTLSAMQVCDHAARELVKLLDGKFVVGPAEPSGMDFYAARSPLVLNGATVGYVLAGGKSVQQASTVHVNLFGGACLYVTPRDLQTLATWIDALDGWITRTDLALDVWSGLDVTEVQAAWHAGQFDVRGKRPGQKEHGSWSSGHSRTFEVGNRGTGKLLRAYEKGDELLGHEANDPWVRLEVEFRASHRVIETDVLRRPADFFAGAYPYCAEFLKRLDLGVSAERIPTHAEVKDKTAEAAVIRVVRWVRNTAAPALAAVWNMGGDMVAHVIEESQHRQTRRLNGFNPADIRAAFDQVARAFAPPVAPFAIGAGA